SSQLLLLSARSEAALDAATERLASHLKAHPELPLADMAYTLQVGRKRHGRRRMLVCRGLEDAAEALASREPTRVLGGATESENRPVMFMFSGQGAQYVDMGRQLYEQEPAFRAEVDACAEKLKGLLGVDLRTLLYPPEAERESAAERLKQTALTQPALFVVEYALAKLWMSWGVQPRAMVGHSIGEYVAACLAGVFSLDDALALVSARGRLMQQMPSGSMLAVSLPESEVQSLLGAGLSLAAVNSPDTCVVAGPTPEVEALAEKLAARGVSTTRLHTSHAFHASMMDPILDAFREQVRKVARHAPRAPYLSNVTGTWVTAEQAVDPDYWAKHLRQAVRFADGLGELLKEKDAILLEVGPGQTLATLARQHPAKSAQHVILNSLRHPREQHPDVDFLLGTLGKLWLAGIEPDWDAFHDGERRRRLPLPTYPFERQRHWVEPKEHGPSRPQATSADQKLDVARWFHLPSWQRALPPPSTWAEEKACWWLFVPEAPGQEGLGARMARRLKEAGQEVVTVHPGERCEKLDTHQWTVGPREAGDYATLVQQLGASGLRPERVVHLWQATAEAEPSFATAQERGFFSLVFLAQALARQPEEKPLSLLVVTHGAQALGDEVPCAERATVLGPCRVIPQELPHLTCRAVDVRLPPAGSWKEAALAEQLLAECAAGSRTESVVAWRGQQRHVPVFEPVPADAPRTAPLPLRERGVYLVLGGLGTLGYAHAEVLAKRVQARLVLVGRTPLPERTAWEGWLASHGTDEATSSRILKVRALEALGAEVGVASGDVADKARLRALVEETVTRFGALHGVVFAAGTVDPSLFRPLQDVGTADAEALFQSRALGLYALEEALEGRALDFCLVSSSLAAVLGGVGRTAYAAATAFMDAFALRRTQASPTPWVGVDWDAWQLESEAGASLAGANPFGALAITSNEGVEAVEHLLSLGAVPQVAIATSNLRARQEQAAGPVEAKASEKALPADAGTGAELAPRPAMQNAYVAPRDELEESIARVWATTLGITQVGVYDNFFELGGNSLVGVKLIARLREQFNVSIPAVTLYEGPTVDALARLLKASAGASSEEGEEETESRGRGERRRARRQRRGGTHQDEEEES
ncbi:MAG TPA: SDR family oxidoreductase, partial [Myxococcaceae bacterium]|nr:SDR family oxidoreductase [Myxococcaceae bacterium]